MPKNRTNVSADLSEAATLIRDLPRQNRGKRDFNLLDETTRIYLKTDKQKLQDELDQATEGCEKQRATNLARRLTYYYLVEYLFFYLIEQGWSTNPANITADQIEDFLNRQRPVARYLRGKQSYVDPSKELQKREKTELKAFFARAELNGVVQQSPMTAFVRFPQKLVPVNLSFRTVADCLGFERYLQRRVDNNFLSPMTADLYKRQLRIFLHDIELYHASDPSWPLELDSLFSDPKWVWEWLNNLENRSSSPTNELANSTVQTYLLMIRQVWLFLKSQKRAAADYYKELKEMFRVDDDIILLPGRGSKIIETLSEAEEEAVFNCIDRYSTTPVLRLRDQALFITALETTIRMDGLNSMRLENFKELEPGIHTCWVKIKRSGRKDARSRDRLGKNQAEWGDWYMSPRAMAAIEKYLTITNRDWNSQGPVWLTNEGKALSLVTQKGVINDWLKIARCRFTRPHILRHTGIERLINKFNKPISVVQEISHHANPKVLLEVYARGNRIDTFRMVNQVWPADNLDDMGFEDLILSVGARLNEISAGISRRSQEKRIFNHQQTEELLKLLSQEIEKLATFLNRGSTSAVVLLSKADYQCIGDTLQTAGFSYEQILGYEPTTQQRAILQTVGRKPKPLLQKKE